MFLDAASHAISCYKEINQLLSRGRNTYLSADSGDVRNNRNVTELSGVAWIALETDLGAAAEAQKRLFVLLPRPPNAPSSRENTLPRSVAVDAAFPWPCVTLT